MMKELKINAIYGCSRCNEFLEKINYMMDRINVMQIIADKDLVSKGSSREVKILAKQIRDLCEQALEDPI